MSKKGKFSSITRINENNLLIEYNPCEFYLYDLENLQIVNNYQFDKRLNKVYITDNYFIIIVIEDKNIKKEIKIQNIFNSKFEKIYNFIYFNWEFKTINEFIFLPNNLLCYWRSGLIYLNNNDAK